jgi:hypothetical protein
MKGGECMVKQFIISALLTLALWGGGSALAQTIDYTSPTATPSETMSPSPTVTGTMNSSGSGLESGQGAGAGTTMPNSAPNTGEGGLSQ